LFDQDLADLLAKLNGIIWRKVEVEGSLMKVYTRVLQRMNEIDTYEGLEGLRIVGEIGG